MRSWWKGSLTRKIGSLSLVLLSFLFLVILYSVFTLQRIDGELREVAEIDVPLAETMADIETLQLKQHLVLEQLELAQLGVEAAPLEVFRSHRSALLQALNKAEKVLDNALRRHQLRLDIGQHRDVLQKIDALKQSCETFEQAIVNVLALPVRKEADWQALEPHANRLDQQMEAMLAALDNLTLEAARYTEKHEREFMLVNAVLGISALGIGLYLTLYIIDVLRRRIGRLQGDLDSLQLSLASGEPITVSPATEVRYVDELGTLEQDLRAMIASLSQRFADRRAVEKSLLELATQDKLTGAGNRHKWEEQLQLELSLAARGGHFSLIMIDVDHFKRINDRHGHEVGDRVLKRMAARLRERLRCSDQLFRLGGEEFAILLRQLELTTALTLADELRALLGSDPDSALPPFSVSMGVTEYRPGDDAALLVKRADAALYAAKSQGRDCVQSA